MEEKRTFVKWLRFKKERPPFVGVERNCCAPFNEVDENGEADWSKFPGGVTSIHASVLSPRPSQDSIWWESRGRWLKNPHRPVLWTAEIKIRRQ